MEELISVNNLGKYFGPIKAVDGVTFNVSKGEVLGFLGPNGAGKSTTMKMLTCFIQPNFGTAEICGFDILKNPFEVRQKLGYLPESAPAYEEMTVKDFLEFVAKVRNIPSNKIKERLEDTYEKIELGRVLHQNIGTLSKGYKRRVGLAQAILHDPEILILDEPTDGLDPNQKYEVRKLIREMAEEKVILLSTHILEEVDEVCTRCVIISEGKVVADDIPKNLHRTSPHFGMVNLSLDPSVCTEAKEYFSQVGVFKDILLSKDTLSQEEVIQLYPKEGEIITPRVIEMCQEKNWLIQNISVDQGRLAEVFRSITTPGKETVS